MDLFTGADPTMDDEQKGFLILSGRRDNTCATQMRLPVKKIPEEIRELAQRIYPA